MTAIAQQMPTGRMKIHTVRGRRRPAPARPRVGPRRTGRRSCSSTAGRRTTSAGTSSTRARLRDEFRLVAYDLRGHGMSEAPLGPEHYTDGKLWADDVAAIIEQLQPRPAGARRLVLRRLRHLRLRPRIRPGADRRDRLRRRRGQARRGGVRHADRPRLPRPFRGRHVRRPADQHRGHALLRPGLRRRSRCRTRTSRRAVCWNVMVPARIRANLAAREIDCDDVLRALEVPLLVTQGRADTVVLPAMAEHVLADLPHRRGLLVRRRRSRAVPGGARALQPRTGRADPPRPRLASPRLCPAPPGVTTGARQRPRVNS